MLFMPNGINQTMHTHPSLRCGIIVSGEAECETLTSNHGLSEGLIFILPQNGNHKFCTDKNPLSNLILIAFHPDSDFGPDDENHPMINRTIVDGVSASQIKKIQTV
jgi:quercetin dioxygenase-like cupin family protein